MGKGKAMPANMSVEEYISRIKFRLVQPTGGDGLWNWLPALWFWTPVGRLFEEANTVLPEDEIGSKRLLAKLSNIPRLSTFAIAAIIDRCVREMPDDQMFVNVGVWNGFTLFAGMVRNPQKLCVGVDNFSEWGGPRQAFASRFRALKSQNHSFFEMDFREYFRAVQRDPIGVYIYDAAHDYQSQLEGLTAAEPFFAKGCVVLVDDTNANYPRKATFDFIAQSKQNYRVIADITTTGNKHPTFWNGLIIFRKET